jgi:hypothetical protein
VKQDTKDSYGAIFLHQPVQELFQGVHGELFPCRSVLGIVGVEETRVMLGSMSVVFFSLR